MNESIDALQLNLDSGGLHIMNLSLAIIMFGVALELTIEDFKKVAKNPKGTIVGLSSQFILLPALTFLLVLLLKPHPSFALGMMMVAACPGGNISNFFSLLARGNAALSVSMTAFATFLSIIMTPFNFAFWASLYGPTNAILTQIHLDLFEVFRIIVLILGIPLLLGMTLRHFRDKLSQIISPYIKNFGIIFFAGFVIVAFSMNFENFISYVHLVVVLVFLHNSIALMCGYGIGYLFKLPRKDRKSIAIETGIQNSGLGLLLIFNFFDGLGGMALVAAWWGIWHIVAGLSIGWYWSIGKSTLQRVFSNA
ncbi:MAG: bile acid:sodium symporter family protein [Gracilimonas sp.]|uniref:bile acid:sodium symporter family protein n=1 Tax=Gracilimonas sp. TaxID=1974203 RepID=UPI0019B80A9C|nr:bile acid:sodium symporter family protein [Gracilimonas sp.]MBD3616858.1 bile acid:sodium symporter family protein [Gracilimonas sp.]